MKSIFTWLTQISLRFWMATLVLMLLLVTLGAVGITQLKQELLPSIEFPQTVILTQTSGMTSDQVLNVITNRLETALANVDSVVNVESTTTGAFGSIIVARNNFGLNQASVQQQVQNALDNVWLPLRRIEPATGQDASEFARTLLADISPEILIYLETNDTNFLFQLTPEVWETFSEETIRTTLAYLAAQQSETDDEQSTLRRLINQEIVPQLESLELVARVSVSGGQALPGKEFASVSNQPDIESTNLLLKLSHDVWQVVSRKLNIPVQLNDEALRAFEGIEYAVPASPPPLPENWRYDHFVDTSDLLEMRTLTRTIAAVFNDFYKTGRIAGSLGQTNDLTADDIQKMLEIDPSMVVYFKAEHLATMSSEAFAALPEDFIAGLDGFTRDELAAKALATTVTGQQVEPAPVNLPAAWRISLPQLISFSFDDIPLATFSVFSTGSPVAVITNSTPANDTQATNTAATNDPAQAETTSQTRRDIPDGPALPPIFALLGGQLGTRIDTADDLIDLPLPESFASQLGSSTLRAADLLNFILLLGNPDSLPPGVQASPIPINPQAILGGLSADAVAFLVEYDPTFLPNLQSGVFDSFSDEVLKLPQIAPPLSNTWQTLSQQPQFSDQPLKNAADIITLGNGLASSVLNQINKGIPERFAGYEVRLFDSLGRGTVRYFSLQEADFFAHLDTDVLKKFSPDTLTLLPEDVLSNLDAETSQMLQAIASGDQESAAQQLAARYTSNVPPADPDAPALNAEWGTIGNFMGVELNSADDLFRFFPDAAGFINSFFDSAQGLAFAPNLLGGMSSEAVNYMVNRDSEFLIKLRTEALQLFSPEVLASFPSDVQERASSGAEAFQPTAAITRTNGNPSLLVTVFKKSGANTVEAFHRAEEAIQEIDNSNETIATAVSFEQASFIEESISGVAREGGLGGVFAIVVILVFLSSGHWSPSPRRLTGAVITALCLVGLALVVVSGLDAAGGNFTWAFERSDIIARLLLILGALAGVLVLFWPGDIPYPAWRSTLVVSVSIPLSVLMALALMNWLPPAVNQILAPAAENSALLAFVLKLFPASLTINIMTLSGLTVAIGRVVDDAIVVLENIFRHVQEGQDKKQAIINGTREVSVAIFSATVITVVVFLPLGLTSSIISEFFLPFGLAVTYALLSSFVVAITVVPLLAYWLIGKNEASETQHEGRLEQSYVPALKWALKTAASKRLVIVTAIASLLFAGYLFSQRPTTFIPGLGEPQISVNVNLPNGTKLTETNTKASELEKFVFENNQVGELGNVQTIVGSGGASIESLLGLGGGVTENIASITIGVESQAGLESWTQAIRAKAESIFGHDNVRVSAATISDQGFGGLELVLYGPEEDLKTVNQLVLDTLNGIPGIANASSDLQQVSNDSDNAPRTYIRINGQSAVSYSAELETENTLGVTQQAMEAIQQLPDLPTAVTVSQGFNSELQTEGFQSLGISMAIAIGLVVLLLMITFRSVVHWFDIAFSILVAPVGAAVLLTITNRVLGISAMIGLLMLIGIVVTNAVVLIDRVQQNRYERGMSIYDALVEAGGRRLRPILMTALATIFALLPLAFGLSKGAIIASELGTVVIGGLLSSTLLTLIVVPVMYSLLAPVHKWLAGRLSRTH
jgi:multidrug efflux pump subunit AcrB